MHTKKARKICWKEAKVWQAELKVNYTKLKELNHMSLVAHLISKLSLDLSHIWNPVIEADVKNCDFALENEQESSINWAQLCSLFLEDAGRL
jgi:hypothetical protein